MKPIVLLATALCSSVSLFAQQDYNIQGKVPASLNGAKIFLYDGEGTHLKGAPIDSTIASKGGFTFKGRTIDPAILTLFFRSPDVAKPYILGAKSLFVGPGDKVKIDMQADSVYWKTIRQSPVTGSEVNKDYESLRALLEPIETPLDSIRVLTTKRAEGAPLDSSLISQRGQLIRKYMVQQDAVKTKFMQTHPNSFVSIYLLSIQTERRITDLAPAQQLFNSFSSALKASELGKKVAENIAKSAQFLPGQVAPDFSAAKPDGSTMKLSDLRGKYVLVDFWASWCGPCRAENPNVVKAYETFKGKGFDILGVSLDKPDAKAKWEEAIAKDGLVWHHVSELKGWEGDIPKLYFVRSIPTNFLLDPSGKIIDSNLRGERLQQVLKTLLENK